MVSPGGIQVRQSGGFAQGVAQRQIEIPVAPMLDWIDETLRCHRWRSRPFSVRSFRRLSNWVSPAWLNHARAVIVDCVPGVPLARLGLAEQAIPAHLRPVYRMFAAGQVRGLTLMNTCFIRRSDAGDESLFLHEMVHTVQWEYYGVSFLPTYLSGLFGHGNFHESPLEAQAYLHQRCFAARGHSYAVDEAVRSELGLLHAPTEAVVPRALMRVVPPEDIIAAARSLVGTPYRHSGRDVASGIDCGGLVLLTLRRAGCVEQLDWRPFPYPGVGEVRDVLSAHGSEVPLNDVSAGDICLFEGSRDRPHLGIITGAEPLTMVHATRDRGVVEEPVGACPMPMIMALCLQANK